MPTIPQQRPWVRSRPVVKTLAWVSLDCYTFLIRQSPLRCWRILQRRGKFSLCSAKTRALRFEKSQKGPRVDRYI
ncbi:uncharacterized protein YALI1_C25513g [Yarrowia lipolytica]|uniref:Uncharacterized protein n=1 Tax=Yarrowia lipolytica TaxID=4952 RepID=A0A1D8NBP0_YARLL|nr:hypothetical protein YALI1_C25513g [Yarrowia lipolytica]